MTVCNCDVYAIVDFGKDPVEIRCTETGNHIHHKCEIDLGIRGEGSITDPWVSFRSMGRFPDRYVEGLERKMAEALWENFLIAYPGLKDLGWTGGYPSLPQATFGLLNHQHSWVVGKAKQIIEHARICASQIPK